jgi:hypothetical protein
MADILPLLLMMRIADYCRKRYRCNDMDEQLLRLNHIHIYKNNINPRHHLSRKKAKREFSMSKDHRLFIMISTQ